MSYFPVPTDAFDDHLPKSVGQYLVTLLNWLWALVGATTAPLHLYLNADTGDDLNSGLTESQPKKTWQALFNAIPVRMRHLIVLHVRGEATGDAALLGARLYEAKLGATYASIMVIDGGDDVVVVDDKSGSNYTATSSAVGSITDTGATWGANAVRGYMVEVLTGAAAGERRAIKSHTGDTLTLLSDFDTDPGVGATFRIVRWATSVAHPIHFRGVPGITITIQKIYFPEGGRITANNCNVGINLSHLIFEGGGSQFAPALAVSNCAQCAISSNTRSVVDGSYITYGTADFGITVRAPTVTTSQSIKLSNHTTFLGVFASLLVGDVVMANVLLTNYCLDYGTHVEGQVSCRGVKAAYVEGDGNERRLLGDATIVNSSGVGLKLRNCEVALQAGDISGCGSHAIEAVKSLVNFTGAVAGGTNTGAGCYAHSGSVVHVKTGSLPTLTGTVGDLTFDGTTPIIWASGLPANSPAECSMAKAI
jgi:hypothetical protein